MNVIELGFRKFHNLPEEQSDLSLLLREGYNKNSAYLWSYPSGSVITYSKDLEANINANPYEMFDLEGKYDREYILRREDFKPYHNPRFRYEVLTKEDENDLNDFLSKCSNEDKDYGQVSIDDPIIVGVYDQERLVAAASIWFLENDLADIGLIVDPDYRSLGLGKSVSSFLIEQLPDEKVPVYRSDIENHGSTRIAESLGFTLFGRIYRVSECRV
ncbi:GNAT family N-acetyltransferase [Acidaminobacter sp. JC074]|uniref:GNAT family N-acetyltransferase n=1 Tax=Acidaminobacter sp. JC074 TaxID=2530199 RepID=UPI001F0E2121|nr:GNAT family N-acetyltransferase [Acidaminobacter sp. JC074]